MKKQTLITALTISSVLSNFAYAQMQCSALFPSKPVERMLKITSNEIVINTSEDWAKVSSGNLIDVISRMARPSLRSTKLEQSATFQSYFKTTLQNVFRDMLGRMHVNHVAGESQFALDAQSQMAFNTLLDLLPKRFNSNFSGFREAIKNPNWANSKHNVALFLWLTAPEQLNRLNNKNIMLKELKSIDIPIADLENMLNRYFETGKLIYGNREIAPAALQSGLNVIQKYRIVEKAVADTKKNPDTMYFARDYRNDRLIEWVGSNPSKSLTEAYLKSAEFSTESIKGLLSILTPINTYSRWSHHYQGKVSDLPTAFFMERNFLEAVRSNLESGNSEISTATAKTVMQIAHDISRDYYGETVRYTSVDISNLTNALKLISKWDPKSSIPTGVTHTGQNTGYKTAEQVLSSFLSSIKRAQEDEKNKS